MTVEQKIERNLKNMLVALLELFCCLTSGNKVGIRLTTITKKISVKEILPKYVKLGDLFSFLSFCVDNLCGACQQNIISTTMHLTWLSVEFVSMSNIYLLDEW